MDSGNTNEIYNVAGGYEQQNIDTVKKIIKEYYSISDNWQDYVDLSYTRVGQDVRYALDDQKLRNLGWAPQKVFDEEIKDMKKWFNRRTGGGQPTLLTHPSQQANRGKEKSHSHGPT